LAAGLPAYSAPTDPLAGFEGNGREKRKGVSDGKGMGKGKRTA